MPASVIVEYRINWGYMAQRTQSSRHGAIVAVFAATLAPLTVLPACQNAAAKREELPPANGTGTAFGGNAEAEPPMDVNIQRQFGIGDLKWSTCVEPADDGTLLAKSCESGAVLFGPYGRVPKNATVVVRIVVEGVSGTGTLAADVVSHAGSRMHGWVSQQAIREGVRETIEFGASIGASATDFETRLWQSDGKGVVFKILDANIETRGP